MKIRSLNTNLEIWGGVECTINRVGDLYLDQLQYSKHFDRPEDIDLIASLGIKKLRYPVLWEYHQPEKGTDINWSLAERQLNGIRSHGIDPIVGLVHHGSGPAYTDLLDENFPFLLAAYAKKVATKFPWIENYTPVNEPLTTARFSGLYGLWYPHHKNDISFARMIINQLKGIVLSMKAIREINPSAKLIQTEDLGKTYSTPYLHHQASFENERRWLTSDLLCGKLRPSDAMWKYFLRLGIPEDSLEFFIENPCPPDVMGFNHYVTSERYLDENLSRYPDFTHGGNEIQDYADVEAVRVHHEQPSGLKILLKEAHERVDLPIAITEAHLNCTREEQLRWLKEVWDSCIDLRNEGIPIVAVTAWSLFGAFGWNQLLTSKIMEYEPGAFDARSGVPRPTALASLIKDLAAGNPYIHPVIHGKGWWHKKNNRPEKSSGNEPPPVLIIGKTGTLGRAYAKICKSRGIAYKLLNRQELDISNNHEIKEAFLKYKPWAVINTAGFVKVDEAESQVEACYTSNFEGPVLLAHACKQYGIQLMTFSSDLVFDGKKDQPYIESDVVTPLNIYGKSKADMERRIIEILPASLVIRTSSFFGPWDNYNFVKRVIDSLSSNEILTAADDVVISPTYVPDLVNVSLDLLIDNEEGICHLTNKGETSWASFAKKIAQHAGLDSSLVVAQPAEKMGWTAVRPRYSVLKSERGILLPSLTTAISRYFEDTRMINEPVNLETK